MANNTRGTSLTSLLAAWGLALLCLFPLYARGAVDVLLPAAEESMSGTATDSAAPDSATPGSPSSPGNTSSESAATANGAAEENLSPARMPWNKRLDKLAKDKSTRAPDMEDPDKLFSELTELLNIRTRQFDLVISEADSREELASSHVEVLTAIFPAADPTLLELPESVITVQDVHENYLALYNQRIRLLRYVSPELRMQITGTDLVGMQQLYFEAGLVWLELRYQVLRLPSAGRQIMLMLTRAPLPLIWFVVQLSLLVFLFVWWRGWFPETLNRMRTYLLSLRPRTPEIVQRMRGLWYVGQVRSPLEWLVFLQLLISLFAFLQLEFISSVSQIIITWVFLSWFAVEFLDALIARGAGGLSSDIGKTRQRSFRLLAVWFAISGLSLDLANRFAGDAALYSLVWRLIQVLSLPLFLAQLSMWRMQIYRRVQSEDPKHLSQEAFEGQRGPAKYVGTMSLLGFLFANWLRKLLLRSLEKFGATPTALIERNVVDDDTDLAGNQQLDPVINDLLLSAELDYPKYARNAKRKLIERIQHGSGGSIVVIGERGIGKDSFVRQVCEGAGVGSITLDCSSSKASEVERQLAEHMGISGPVNDREVLLRAFAAKDIRIISIRNVHMLVRPVVGGFKELIRITQIFDLLPDGVIRIMGMDRYAWQYIRSALAERAASVELVELSEWSDEQISDLLDMVAADAGLNIDFTSVRLPSQYIEPNIESLEDRNRSGIYTMAARLSGGNPSIALRLFAGCLQQDDKGRLTATLPANPVAQSLEQASLHVLLVLRVIAQGEYITREDIIENLRYPASVVENALQYSVQKNWVDCADGLYTLAWPWFRTITRVLSRQNLLAGVRQMSS